MREEKQDQELEHSENVTNTDPQTVNVHFDMHRFFILHFQMLSLQNSLIYPCPSAGRDVLSIQLQMRKVCMHVQLCATLCNPMDCSLPGSSVHGILQATIQEWVAMPFSRDLLHPGIKPASLMSPALSARFFITSATWETRVSRKERHT